MKNTGVLLPFIKDGFERAEKAFHIIDPKLRETPPAARVAGIDAGAEQKLNGQFELRKLG